MINRFLSWLLIKVLIILSSPTYALYFSIAIIRVSASGGTRLLGKVEASKGEILTLVEQKQSMDHIVLDLYADE